jgi:hypothetical protein
VREMVSLSFARKSSSVVHGRGMRMASAGLTSVTRSQYSVDGSTW